MSITIDDVLRLPALIGAEVLAGRDALSKSVESVTVLEYGEISELQEQFFQHNQFEGNELIITAFASICDNVEAQCINIRKCHSVGAAGFILYYVGILVPEVDQRLIDLCDELSFPLICMPKGQINLRYSEAISEIMNEVYHAHQKENYFVSKLFLRMYDLQPHQRDLNALMRMLSDYLHVTVILSNTLSGSNLCVCWPRALIDSVEKNLDNWLRGIEDDRVLRIPFGDAESYLQQCPVLSNNAGEYRLYLLNYKAPLSKNVLWQTSELFRMFGNIRNQNADRPGAAEIVNSIINDDVVQMTRLSRMFNINVDRLNQMWIFHPKVNASKYSANMVRSISEHFSTHYDLTLTSYYDDNLVSFTCAPNRQGQRQKIMEEMSLLLEKQRDQCEIICHDCLHVYKSARTAYWDSVKYLDMARKLYPEKLILSSADILFTKQCCQVMADQAGLEQYLEILTRIRNAGGSLDTTAEIYLLDASSNMTQTAKRLFAHVNTVKYRLHLLHDLLGYAPGKMPDAYPLYMAVALNRLMR